MDKKELIKKLRDFKKRIKEKHKIEKIILFGSRTNDKYKKSWENDVDLIIVGKFKEKTNLKRTPPLYFEWDIDLPVDFLCYTPEEFNQLSKKITIVREAIKNGIIIQ